MLFCCLTTTDDLALRSRVAVLGGSTGCHTPVHTPVHTRPSSAVLVNGYPGDLPPAEIVADILATAIARPTNTALSENASRCIQPKGK